MTVDYTEIKNERFIQQITLSEVRGLERERVGHKFSPAKRKAYLSVSLTLSTNFLERSEKLTRRNFVNQLARDKLPRLFL